MMPKGLFLEPVSLCGDLCLVLVVALALLDFAFFAKLLDNSFLRHPYFLELLFLLVHLSMFFAFMSRLRTNRPIDIVTKRALYLIAVLRTHLLPAPLRRAWGHKRGFVTHLLCLLAR